MIFNIETDRLILRDLRPSDDKDMFELDSNSSVHQYLGNNPFTHIEQSQKNIKSILSQYEANGIGRWALIEKSSEKFMGWSGLRLNTEYEMNGHSNYMDIGYRLLPEFWGKGFATESSIAALNYAFNTMKLKLVNGITKIDNAASHTVLLKIGLKHTEDFIYEKEQMKLRWYELKSEDYEKNMS
ncbi:GNAT family N-acetyltransferase [Flavobacteriales bacterium 34_180_T64]|nr:GNAT family N-acetyltransferase [Flavobacteriales bacterium 34_180_T64]